jgi:hypothetical protein
VAVAAGLNHSVALRQDGAVLIWGQGDSGQLGNGGLTNLATPTLLTGISNVIAIAGGADHTMALTADKTVWTWGDNSKGQLGDGTTTTRTTPVPVTRLSNVVAIAAGAQLSLAVTSNGQVYAWGDNSFGGLATNGISATNNPLVVAGLSNVVLVSAGRDLEEADPQLGFAVAVSVPPGGSQYLGWGYNGEGEVGGATNVQSVRTPVPVQFCTRCQRCVQLGTSGSFTAQCTGTLRLYFNDEQSGVNDSFGDNSGSYTVTVASVANNIAVPASAANGIAVGIVSNGVSYTFSASGTCSWDRTCTNCVADADGNHNGAVNCSSVITPAFICPAARCYSLVGKIQ